MYLLLLHPYDLNANFQWQNEDECMSHSQPYLAKLYLTVVTLTRTSPIDLTRVTSRPSPEDSSFSWSLYSAYTPPMNPKMPEMVDCGSGLKTRRIRVWVPVCAGRWMLPYPRTKERPKKSVPQRARTNCGHPARVVVSKDIQKGRFHTISCPSDAAT